ncbi:hypothetical protein GCM10010505_54780 [Kitasatospora aburaviensis]
MGPFPERSAPAMADPYVSRPPEEAEDRPPELHGTTPKDQVGVKPERGAPQVARKACVTGEWLGTERLRADPGARHRRSAAETSGPQGRSGTARWGEEPSWRPSGRD